jgi:hypothetical protein
MWAKMTGVQHETTGGGGMTDLATGDLSAEPAAARRPSRLALAGTATIVAEFAWLTIVSAKAVHPGGDPWQTGDWLIDLSAGPVRRGIFGSLLFAITDSPNVVWLAFGIQIGVLAILSALAIALFWASPRTPAWCMLTFSPAFLLFPSLSPEGALRKELLGLAAFALLAAAVRFRWRATVLVGVTVLFVLGTTAHEVTGLMLPAFVYLVEWARRHGIWITRAARTTIGVMAVTSVAALGWALLFSASSADVSEICSSWTAAGLDRELCSGALRFHSRSLSDSLDLTKAMFPAYLSLVPLVVLSILPLVAVRAPRRIWLLLGATFVALAPLFLVAIDYGRWCYIGIGLVSLTCLTTWTHGDFGSTRTAGWMAVCFVALWSFPYAGPRTNDSLLMQVLRSPIERIVGTPTDRPAFEP